MTHTPDYGGLEAVALRARDGARAVITLHGGHVVSWVPAGGDEMLYLSPRSSFVSGQAIRGGVPVIFPQFSARGPLTRHGFARGLAWRRVREETSAREASVVLRLTDDAVTRQSWDHRFELDLAVRVGGNSLHMALSCRNTGSGSFDFSAALHTYLHTSDIGRTLLHGLGRLPYWDALDGGRKTQLQGALGFDGELDRVYGGATGTLVLQVAAGADQRHIQITQSGFEDVVVWNPGAAKCAALADMPPDGWREMVCVEAARIERPVVLEPGQSWVGTQHLLQRNTM